MSRMRTSRGFTLLEAIILIVVLSIIAVGMGTALQAIARTPTEADAQVAIGNALTDRMEALRGTAFDSLSVGTTNDEVTINGTAYTRTATVALFDADGDGTADADCKQLTVTMGGQTVRTLVVQP